MNTALIILMPCSLFILSILQIHRSARTLRIAASSETLWLCAYIMVNVLSALWAANILSSLDNGFSLPKQMVIVSSKVGVILFVSFSIVLGIRPAVSLLSALLSKGKRRCFSR